MRLGWTPSWISSEACVPEIVHPQFREIGGLAYHLEAAQYVALLERCSDLGRKYEPMLLPLHSSEGTVLHHPTAFLFQRFTHKFGEVDRTTAFVCFRRPKKKSGHLLALLASRLG